ncbi:hypothetical protein [Aquimarina litoralis]|uniref:hypothetical protein n=1 Tax=Aquimarina litoralis TaxID=584605 RepID=UPI001C58B702|nr:hypothetical protein [Aquimarina litoralis]MBW1297811.1 hypothetical protein [Aquimarina litoralis]
MEAVKEIMEPYFQENGKIDMHHFEQKKDVSYLLALMINCEFVLDTNTEISNFGADDIIPVRLEIEDNTVLKYWGKINWLSKPSEHQCHRSFQDPFYGEFTFDHQELKIEKMLFGSYDQTDLDGSYWVDAEVNWMYEFKR